MALAGGYAMARHRLALVKIIFHMKPMWDERMKLYSKGPGQMTKIAAMPI